MNELLVLRVRLRNDMMTTVRLATGGVCSLAGLSYDGGEDCKVCVTESLLLLLRGGYGEAEVTFTCDDRLHVSVAGIGRQSAPAPSDEDEIAAALLNALADDVLMRREQGALCAVEFAFGLQA